MVNLENYNKLQVGVTLLIVLSALVSLFLPVMGLLIFVGIVLDLIGKVFIKTQITKAIKQELAECEKVFHPIWEWGNDIASIQEHLPVLKAYAVEHKMLEALEYLEAIEAQVDAQDTRFLPDLIHLLKNSVESWLLDYSFELQML